MNRNTKRIFLTSIVLAPVLVVIAALVAGGQFAVGAAAGGVIGSVNLWLMYRFVSVLVAQGEAVSGRVIGARFVVKYLVLAAALFGAVYLLNVHPLALAVGISNVPLAIVLEVFRPPMAEADPEV